MAFKYTFILYEQFFSDLLYPDNDSQSSSSSSKRKEEASSEPAAKKKQKNPPKQMPSWFEDFIKEEKGQQRTRERGNEKI